MPKSGLAGLDTSCVYDVAIESPLEYAPVLSERTGRSVWLKREDLQPVFSFKLRGAYCMMRNLPRANLARGVVAASAGNHAQGVALAAQRLGTRAVIVVPETIAPIKAAAIRRLGADLVLHGDDYDCACAHARSLAAEWGMTFVHPYDNPAVIAGQATIGREIDLQHPGTLEAVFVPVGGGGLLAGVAQAMKASRPEVKVFGVEPEGSDAMSRALAAGYPVELERVSSLADGVAVRRVGDETFRICRELVDGIITVTDDEICAAVKDVFEDCRAVLEPSGALAYAGLKRHDGTGHAVAICSGANLNFDRLRHIAERAEIGEQREAVFAIHIPERPGEFRRLCAVIGERNITEFNYRMGDPETATVFAGVQVGSRTERADLYARLASAYEVADLTDDELAKTHVRHMVGGRSTLAIGERLFQFDFPEMTGALARFLECLAGQWNISLFHYRNHGADRGRVLAGFQVGSDDITFNAFRTAIGYPCREVTENPAVKFFLR